MLFETTCPNIYKIKIQLSQCCISILKRIRIKVQDFAFIILSFDPYYFSFLNIYKFHKKKISEKLNIHTRGRNSTWYIGRGLWLQAYTYLILLNKKSRKYNHKHIIKCANVPARSSGLMSVRSLACSPQLTTRPTN